MIEAGPGSGASRGLDTVDRAFVRRLAARQPAIPEPAPRGAGWRPEPARPPGGGLPPASLPPAGIVDRLLAAAPETWVGLAQRVEERQRAGSIVFAVAGAGPAEGRSTLVECLARALQRRGNAVEIAAAAPPEIPLPRSGRRPPIVLVDAGVWFPGGPLRRGWLERRSLGCHAVILVRRADAAPCPQRGPACAAVGLDVLGEVVTMVTESAGPEGHPDDSRA